MSRLRTPRALRVRSATLVVLIAFTVIVAACAPVTTPTLIASPTPTATPAPTRTFDPTSTPTPTQTPRPTNTPIPTNTPTSTPTDTPTPLPTATSLPDLLRPTIPVDEALSGISSYLHASPDGTLWLITGEGIARVQDEAWQIYLTDFTGELAGIDAGRVWVVNEDTTQITAWNGASWTAYGADEGWLPIPLEDGYRDVGWGQSNESKFWLATSQDEAWQIYLADFTGELAGIDAGRIWVVNEDTTQITAWDGASWTAYGADEGWLPIPLEDGYRDVGWGQSDESGKFWLATSQDVRIFDTERWTTFTREDMGMDPPLRANLISVFEVAVLSSGEIWVGECEGAAGLLDGRGLRWFDGQTWHGADSPVASGCVTAIVEDSAGRVWVGTNDLLWRYDPASEDWTQFTPPEPPDPPPLGQWRYAASDIALDPSDDPWVSFLICGAASCDTMVLYHVHEGTWTRIEIPEPVTLIIDATGTPWLFSVDAIFRVAGDVPELVANLYAKSFTVDAAGRVWFLAWHEGQDWLWTLDTETGE